MNGPVRIADSTDSGCKNRGCRLFASLEAAAELCGTGVTGSGASRGSLPEQAETSVDLHTAVSERFSLRALSHTRDLGERVGPCKPAAMRSNRVADRCMYTQWYSNSRHCPST
jgi:hypothetical protein